MLFATANPLRVPGLLLTGLLAQRIAAPVPRYVAESLTAPESPDPSDSISIRRLNVSMAVLPTVRLFISEYPANGRGRNATSKFPGSCPFQRLRLFRRAVCGGFSGEFGQYSG